MSFDPNKSRNFGADLRLAMAMGGNGQTVTRANQITAQTTEGFADIIGEALKAKSDFDFTVPLLSDVSQAIKQANLTDHRNGRGHGHTQANGQVGSGAKPITLIINPVPGPAVKRLTMEMLEHSRLSILAESNEQRNHDMCGELIAARATWERGEQIVPFPDFWLGWEACVKRREGIDRPI